MEVQIIPFFSGFRILQFFCRIIFRILQFFSTKKMSKKKACNFRLISRSTKYIDFTIGNTHKPHNTQTRLCRNEFTLRNLQNFNRNNCRRRRLRKKSGIVLEYLRIFVLKTPQMHLDLLIFRILHFFCRILAIRNSTIKL